MTDSWDSDYEHLKKNMDAEITRRKIQRISFRHNGRIFVVEVGKPNPYNSVNVRAIYEDGKRGCFLICAGTVTVAPTDSLVEEI